MQQNVTRRSVQKNAEKVSFLKENRGSQSAEAPRGETRRNTCVITDKIKAKSVSKKIKGCSEIVRLDNLGAPRSRQGPNPFILSGTGMVISAHWHPKTTGNLIIRDTTVHYSGDQHDNSALRPPAELLQEPLCTCPL